MIMVEKVEIYLWDDGNWWSFPTTKNDKEYLLRARNLIEALDRFKETVKQRDMPWLKRSRCATQ